MRLFQHGDKQEPEPEAASPEAPPVEDAAPEAAQAVAEEPPAQGEAEEPIYADDGTPLYENEDGTPYDPEGRWNKEPEPPEPETPKPAPIRSPFADQLLTEQERQRAEELVSPEVMPLIETIAARVADRIVASREQSRLVAQDAGIPTDLAARAAAYEQYVPQELRGTKRGAIMAAQMAMTAEASEGENLESVVGRYFTTAPAAPAPPPKKETPILGGAMATPRANPERGTRGTGRYPARNEAEKSFGADGAEQLRIIQSERKSHATR